MNIADERKAIDEALNKYRTLLDTIPDEMFDVTPQDGGWSFAEVYSHILQATIGSTIVAERCANGTYEVTKDGPSLLGRLALMFGYMPKVKVLPVEAARLVIKKLTKEEARNLLIKCRNRIDTITPRVTEAQPYNRFNHSRFGMLNARQWFKITLIHLKHHLKQIERIRRKLSL